MGLVTAQTKKEKKTNATKITAKLTKRGKEESDEVKKSDETEDLNNVRK